MNLTRSAKDFALNIFSILQRQMDEINTVCKQKYLKKHYLCVVSINDAATNTEYLT